MKNSIAVRFEGGMGDHILGMRLLPFIRQHYPKHKIIGYSDAAGSRPQIDILKMSPFLTEVICVHKKKNAIKSNGLPGWGCLVDVQNKYLKMMNSADVFFDAWGGTYFLEQSKMLDVPIHEILNCRSELIIPATCRIKASKILEQHKDCIFVGLNVTRYGLKFLRENKMVKEFIKQLLINTKVIILNFYASDYKFSYWPKTLRMEREKKEKEESSEIGKLWNIDSRVIPLVDYPIAEVAALLQKCKYFIGIDNGIKHLAWALGVPLTYFTPWVPPPIWTLRWFPDYHKHLLFNCSKKDLLRHLLMARKKLS